MAFGSGISCPVARLLKYEDGIWTAGQVDLQQSQALPDVCYIFLEDRDCFKGCTDLGRARILAPFNTPSFLASKLCTESNGYFGCQSSFEAGDGLAGLSMWFRCLVKKVLYPEEKKALDGKDYWWYEMGFFTSWHHPNSSKILCVGTPETFHDRLRVELGMAPSFVLRDPFAMLIPLIGQLIELYTDSTWRVRTQVREIEEVCSFHDGGRDACELTLSKTRGKQRADFVTMHNISRHAIHLNEVCTATIETLEKLHEQQKLTHGAIASLDRTYMQQSQESLRFYLQMLKGLKLRSSSNQERINAEITLAYHIIASQDSAVTKTIAVLTMTFLPASFVASLFGTTFFSSADDKKLAVSSKFWTYWVVAVPSTLLVLLAWWLFLQKSSSRNRWS
ncbi:hypothetical protein CDD80_4798 [Ophiocordyceps camponoti-rufipedis]|uniref:Uncharacterized protein n=1 Tax=Ophiocordyceps camponoti-rufipedis TaxID=2004952 RepID=A0A2C5YXJ4_9HYPO|nr:hypothetical protein CDD80_4798 [Ophiocordyceps camponoti-rufipedis]